jgi:hypothetical protein
MLALLEYDITIFSFWMVGLTHAEKNLNKGSESK